MIIDYSRFGAVLLSSFALVQVVEGSRSNSQCDNDTVDMYSDFSLAVASYAFFKSFSTQCDVFADPSDVEPSICDFPAGNPTPKTDVFVSYAPLHNRELYEEVVNTCKELGDGYKACTLNTEQIIMDNVSIKTIGQPLCMPQTCGSDNEDDLIALLDAQGATPFCTDDDECTVKLQNITCASDETDIPVLWTPDKDRNDHKYASSCAREAMKMKLNQLGDFTNFYDALNELYDDIQLSCLNSAIGDDPTSHKCRMEMEPFSVSMVADFDRMKSDESYVAYTSACEGAGGSLCTISAHFDLAFAYEEGIDAKLKVDMNDLPICFADSCSSNGWGYDFLEDLVLDAIKDNTDFSRRLSHSRRLGRSLIENMVKKMHRNDGDQKRRRAKVNENTRDDGEFSDEKMVQPWDKTNIGRDPSDAVQQPMNEIDTGKASRKTNADEDLSSHEEFLALSDICDALESMNEGVTRCNFTIKPPQCNERGHAQQSQSQSHFLHGLIAFMVLFSSGIVVFVGKIVTKMPPTARNAGAAADGDAAATADGEFV